ncbi:MAG: HEPN domain-containing protein [Anaerolineae bacterium]|nr:HEPN domain-containing protein [Anaerolineae bacterium]
MSSEPFQQWIDRAVEDLAVTRLVFAEGYYAHTCFLAQQSIEKVLKGYLLWCCHTYPRVHNLVDLLALCQAQDEDFADFQTDCLIIDQYYIPTRYPDGVPGTLPGGLPGFTEAQEAVTIAVKVQKFVIAKISDRSASTGQIV